MLRRTHAWEADCFSTRPRKSWCFFVVFFINCFAHLFLILHFTDSFMENVKCNSSPVGVCFSLPLLVLGVCSLFTFLIFTH